MTTEVIRAEPPQLQITDYNNILRKFVDYIDRDEATTRSYLKNLRQFIAWMLYREITKPQREDIQAFKKWLLSEHEAIKADPESVTGWSYRTDAAGNHITIICKVSTAKNYIMNVKQFFKWTASEGLYPDIAANIHTPEVKSDRHKKDALQPEQVQKIEHSIIKAAAAKREAAELARKDAQGRTQRSEEQGKRMRAIYLLSVNAGLRTVEIQRAKIKDFEEKDGQAWLYIWGKGHHEADEKKALAPDVAAAIKDYIGSRKDKPTANSPLFVATGNRSGGKPIATTTISTMIKEALKGAGFNSERLTAHSLRHTAGTTVYQITGDIYATQQYMRHADPKTTEIYIHENKDQKGADIAQQLSDFYKDGKTADKKERLLQMVNTLSISQLEKLADIAETIAR